MTAETVRWLAADRRHAWHPFTDQDEWCDLGHEPLVLVEGDGCWLRDSRGRRYLDGNSSIWTNLHGHRHPRIDQALRAQLARVAHTSYLGFANPRASELAERLCAFFPANTLERVFFSDDGSTAIECALKMAIQYRQQTGEPLRTGFIAFHQGYHGDTMGASSLGGVPLFFERFRNLGLPVRFVRDFAELECLPDEVAARTAAVVIEPLVQGAAGIRLWPPGMLRGLRAWCDRQRVHLILDEVLTGFGRTGAMFACQQERVTPDFLCLAKGLTGGYLPLAATMTTRAVHDAFRGGPGKTFYYGHSYTGNQLGCAAALASLEVFAEEQVIDHLPPKIGCLAGLLAAWAAREPRVHEVRQAGLITGIELRQPGGVPFETSLRTGARACLAARPHGLLTRPIGDTLVLMPPLCVSEAELCHAVAALEHAVAELPA